MENEGSFSYLKYQKRVMSHTGFIRKTRNGVIRVVSTGQERSGTMSTPKRILVPTDFTECSHRALKEALGIAKQSHADVHLLHVVDDTLYECVALEGVCDAIIDKIKQVNLHHAELRMQRIIDGTRARPEQSR